MSIYILVTLTNPNTALTYCIFYLEINRLLWYDRHGDTMNYNYSGAYYYSPEQQLRLQKQQQISAMRSDCNKVGFFVMIYFLAMYALVYMCVFLIKGGILSSSKENEFFMNILYAVGASLIPGLIFIAASKTRISDVLTSTHVKISKMLPIIMFGMGVAMLANVAASLFDSNISLFQLKNYASQDTEGSTLFEFLLSVIGTALVPAFAEEFAFRGIVLSRLRKYGDSFAIFASALLFGAMHGNTTQIVFAFLLGLIFAYVDVKTNSIIPSVIIHFFNNFYAVLANSMVNSNTLTEQQSQLFSYILMVAFSLLGLLSIVYLSKTDKYFFKLNDSAEAVSLLEFKNKINTFIINPGVMIALSLFTAEMIVNMIPPELLGLS